MGDGGRVGGLQSAVAPPVLRCGFRNSRLRPAGIPDSLMGVHNCCRRTGRSSNQSGSRRSSSRGNSSRSSSRGSRSRSSSRGRGSRSSSRGSKGESSSSRCSTPWIAGLRRITAPRPDLHRRAEESHELAAHSLRHRQGRAAQRCKAPDNRGSKTQR